MNNPNYFHHHAYEILNTHDELRDSLVKTLCAEILIQPSIRKKNKGSKGIEAGFLNKEIRLLMMKSQKAELRFEVLEKQGVFYFSSGKKNAIGGFDFAILNHKKNLVALRNLCFGELQYHDGKKRWQKFLAKNADLHELAKEIEASVKKGKDLFYEEPDTETPLIVGEIQFGNWGLVYRDFFKVLKANVQNSIDCLVYIVPTGELENLLSDGIVTFDKTKDHLKEFEKVIAVPVWVIGLDIEI